MGRVGSNDCVCMVCGKRFLAIRFDAKYCSDQCYYVAFNKRRKIRNQLARKKRCIICKIDFQAKRRDALYCSAKCKQKSYRKRVTDKGSRKFTGTDNRNVTEIGCGKFTTTENSNIVTDVCSAKFSRTHISNVKEAK